MAWEMSIFHQPIEGASPHKNDPSVLTILHLGPGFEKWICMTGEAFLEATKLYVSKYSRTLGGTRSCSL